MIKKVFVSGCFDMLHSGHIAFFEEAAKHGDLYVGIGSDKTIQQLKGKRTINTDKERLYIVKAIRYVKDAWINSGDGLLDFNKEIRELKPDIFFVNEDGFTHDKIELCDEMGIQLIISKRIPQNGLPSRSTTSLRTICNIPFRIDLAGGWLDQPYVSKYYPGSVITISIRPDHNFNDRSGMSSSTRKKAIQLWQTNIPEGNIEILAKTLFSFENQPGTKVISGSQDSIGIVYPGVNKLNYNDNYWPDSIESEKDSDILEFIEDHLWLITLGPRTGDYNVLSNTNINQHNAKSLADAANKCWKSIKSKNLLEFGTAIRESFDAQVSMFPYMVSPEIIKIIDVYKQDVIGWKLSGAGGGGYLILVSEKPVKNAIKIKIVI